MNTGISSGLSKLQELIEASYSLFRILPFRIFLKLWLAKSPETIIEINDIRLAIRTRNIFAKSADISMAYECILRDDYTLNTLKLPQKSTIIDIGAHIGSFSLAAASKFRQSRIFCFEPSPANYSTLKKNVAINNLKNIFASNKAVTFDGKNVTIYLSSINSAANSIYVPKKDFIEVPSITLERIFKNNKIKKCDFLKMDCEGAEYDIILNAPIGILSKIGIMVIEYHTREYLGIKNNGYTLGNLIRKLEESGFNCEVRQSRSYQGIIFAKKRR